MKFEYTVELKEGYRPVGEIVECNEVTFTLEAPNKATADRMLRAMLNRDNVIDVICVCVEA